MTPARRRRLFYATSALAAGLCLRLWFVLHAASVDGDVLIYGSIAQNWLEHHVYGFVVTPQGVQPTLIRLPGYPLFLAICFALFGVGHYTAVMLVQCAADLLTCVLTATLATRLFGLRAGTAALWMGAMCPFTATYTAAPLTEALTLLTIATAFYGLERWRAGGLHLNGWVWLMGSAMAYSLLLRPEQGLLAAAVVPAILWLALRGQRETRPSARAILLPAALVSLCILLPLVPWTVRNWRTFGVFQPLAPRSATDPGERTSAGFDRWYRSWAIDYASTEEVYWSYDNADIDINQLPARAFDSRQQYEQTLALLAEYNKNDSASPGLDARFASIAEQRVHADPLRYYITLPAARLLNMIFRPRMEEMSFSLDWWRYKEHPGQTLVAFSMATLNFVYFALGAAGLYLWHQRGWGQDAAIAYAMAAFVFLRCVLLLTLDNSEPRYTLEFFPVLVVWASFLFRRREA